MADCTTDVAPLPEVTYDTYKGHEYNKPGLSVDESVLLLV